MDDGSQMILCRAGDRPVTQRRRRENKGGIVNPLSQRNDAVQRLACDAFCHAPAAGRSGKLIVKIRADYEVVYYRAREKFRRLASRSIAQGTEPDSVSSDRDAVASRSINRTVYRCAAPLAPLPGLPGSRKPDARHFGDEITCCDGGGGGVAAAAAAGFFFFFGGGVCCGAACCCPAC